MPQDFQKDKVPFPKSTLGDIYSDIHYQKPIHRSSFPMTWEYRQQALATPTAPNTTNTQTGAAYSPSNSKATSRGSKQGIDFETDYAHMHPKIKAVMTGVHKKFKGKVQVQEILEAVAGIWWGDLPVIDRFWDKAKNQSTLCWNHICCKCRWGKDCNFVASHEDGVKVLDQAAAEQVVKALQPGLDVMLKDDYARQAYKRRAPSAGGPSNRQCN